MGGRDADLVGDTVSFSILSKCLASVSGEYLSFPPDTNLQETLLVSSPTASVLKLVTEQPCFAFSLDRF